MFANTCAARASETARPHATVIHSNNCDVCHNKTGHETLKLANTCAARASETARPRGTVINSNNNEVCPNTVYCRGIFTDDEDEGNEIVFSQTIKQTIDSYTEPGASLDDKIGSYNAPSRALYESHTHYTGSDPRSVTAVNREAPSSGSSGNLGRGPWGERHPSPVGPTLGPEGHYADMVAEEPAYAHTGALRRGVVKEDKTLARGTVTATPIFHSISMKAVSCVRVSASQSPRLFVAARRASSDIYTITEARETNDTALANGWKLRRQLLQPHRLVGRLPHYAR